MTKIIKIEKHSLMLALFLVGFLFIWAIYTLAVDINADQKTISECNDHWRVQVERVCPALFAYEFSDEFGLDYEFNASRG